jgi:hypothetical protein
LAKRKYEFDEQKLARFKKEGRGEGHGIDYKPWLTIQDVPSNGRSSRIPSSKIPREHHLLSDNERGIFLLLDWSDNVVDVREQFPLDRDITRKIANEMGVVHPMDPKTRTDIVMTTDFLIDIRVGNKTIEIARSVKSKTDIDNPRTIEKQEIERRYWELKNIDWRMFIDTDIPKKRVENLRLLYEMKSFDGLVVPYPDYWQDICTRLMAALNTVHRVQVKKLIKELELTQGLKAEDIIAAIRHLGANKVITFDLDIPFSTNVFISSTKQVSSVTPMRNIA